MIKEREMENEMTICQSCSIPLEREEIIGSNQDCSKNNDYCIYCYKHGEFTDGIKNLEKYTEYSLQFAEQAIMTKEQMRERCKRGDCLL